MHVERVTPQKQLMFSMLFMQYSNDSPVRKNNPTFFAHPLFRAFLAGQLEE